MRILALDPGMRWIGVAVSDGDGRVALPLGVIDRRTTPDGGVAQLRALLGPEHADLVVIGVPLDPERHEDAQAARFRAIGERLAAALGAPCTVQSERYSNPIDEVRAPAARGRRPARSTVAQHQRRRRERHAVAAAAILQRWLDARRNAPVPEASPCVPSGS